MWLFCLESKDSSEDQKSATKQINKTGASALSIVSATSTQQNTPPVEKTKDGVVATIVDINAQKNEDQEEKSAELESLVGTTQRVDKSIGGPKQLIDGTFKKSEEKAGPTLVFPQQTKVDQTVEDIKPAEENLDPLVLLRLYASQDCVSSNFFCGFSKKRNPKFSNAFNFF